MSDEIAKRVYRDLQALARSDYGGATGALLVVYAVEGFLRRLAASEYATKMTLKGGMLMAATAARRMTKDADLSTIGMAHDEQRIVEVVRQIIAVVPERHDGLIFDSATIRTQTMREDTEYQGVRVNSRHDSRPPRSRPRSTSPSETPIAP